MINFPRIEIPRTDLPPLTDSYRAATSGRDCSDHDTLRHPIIRIEGKRRVQHWSWNATRIEMGLSPQVAYVHEGALTVMSISPRDFHEKTDRNCNMHELQRFTCIRRVNYL